MSLRAQEKALQLIAEPVAAKGRALLHIGEGAYVVELGGFGLAIFAALCLLGEVPGTAHAGCNPSAGCAIEWSGSGIAVLPGLPGASSSAAYGVNGAGQVVGSSSVGVGTYATEWSDGKIINLGDLPGSTYGLAYSINDRGTAVGISASGGGFVATEWSGGSVINLGGPPGSTDSFALGINDTGQAVC